MFSPTQLHAVAQGFSAARKAIVEEGLDPSKLTDAEIRARVLGEHPSEELVQGMATMDRLCYAVRASGDYEDDDMFDTGPENETKDDPDALSVMAPKNSLLPPHLL